MSDVNAEWEPFKPDIERLYCFEQKKLHEVREYMKQMYDFDKSIQQYQRQLTKWGFSKNQVQADEWKFICRKTNKRKRDDGKESEVHVRGIQQPRKKVSDAVRSKKTHEKISDIIANGRSPATPEGIVVCTPISPGMRLEWDTSLPWLQFLKLLHPGNSPTAPSPSSSLVVPSPHTIGVSPRTVSRQLMQRLSSILPWNKLNSSLNIYSSSHAATALTILMPEEEKGKHFKLSSCLSDSSHQNRECFKLELFLLSNNFFSHTHGHRTEESMLSNDKHVIKMFKQSGWNNVTHLRMLLSSQEPTACSIVEKLFACALRLPDLDIVKMMLEAGMHADAIVNTVLYGPIGSLQLASAFNKPELVQLLLSHGADVNSMCNGHSALEFAARRRNKSMVQILLAKGATVTPSCFSMAVSYRTVDDITMDILNACPPLGDQPDCQSSMALIHAVLNCNVDIIGRLLVRGADVNALAEVYVDNEFAVTTVLGHAVISCSTALPLLLWACRDINPEFDGLPYVSPLILAVDTKNAEATKLFLEAGMDVTIADGQGKMTLLERATKKKDASLWQLLIAYGTPIERPLSNTSNLSSSPIMHAITEKQFDLAEFLIDAGARLNDEYSKAPGTVLGATIESGQMLLITKLWAQGARALNGQLRRIGNIQTAMYLQEHMVLQKVLQASGPKILADALLSADGDLSHYLLEHDADIPKEVIGFQDSELKPTPLGAAIRKRNFAFADTLLNRGAKVSEYDLAEAIDLGEADENSIFFKRLLSLCHENAPTAVGHTILYAFGGGHLEALREANIDPTGTPHLFRDYWDMDGLDFDFNLEPPQSVLEIAVFMNPEELDFLLQWTPWDSKLIGRALVGAIILKEHKLVDSLLQYNPEMGQELVLRYRLCDEEEEEEEIEKLEIFTPLQAAIKGQLAPVAQRLLAKSSDVNYLGDGARRRTPLQHAVENGNMDLINMLLQHGARVDGPPALDGGATALQIAALHGYIGIARRLIDLGADVNEAPARFNGRTALQGAAEYGRIDMLQMLFNEGVLVVGDHEPQYQRAVGLAEQSGHKIAARLLESYRESVELGTL